MDTCQIDLLLTLLAKRLHCSYISDLHAVAREDLHSAISFLQHQYPPQAWSEAISYVTGESVAFDSHADIDAYFCVLSDSDH